MSATKIDDTTWQITKWIMQKHGMFAAYHYIAPLIWYIKTGRASTEFLRRLCEAKPFVIGRQLVAGGSDDEIIQRVKKKLGV